MDANLYTCFRVITVLFKACLGVAFLANCQLNEEGF
jgi:hypothetical protein